MVGAVFRALKIRDQTITEFNRLGIFVFKLCLFLAGNKSCQTEELYETVV